MIILHVVHGFPPEYLGGTELYVRRLAGIQVDQGHDVRVLTGTHVTAPKASIIEDDAGAFRVATLHRYGLCGDRWHQTASPGAEGRVWALLGRSRPDVVHLHHSLRLCRSVARLAAARGIPVVWTLHDLSSTCPRFNRVLDDGVLCRRPLSVEACLGCAPAEAWQHREEVAGEIRAYGQDQVAELAAAVRLIAPSRAQRDFLEPRHDLPGDRYRVIPHGTLEALKAPAARIKDPGGRLCLVHWGTWYRDKGVHVLLQALERLDDGERNRVHLTIHGKAVFPDYDREIRDRAAGLPVALAGPFEPGQLKAERYDLAVVPSLAHESHSFVLDEAFGLGLPVLASHIGALAERVGRAGKTFPPGDAGALAKCIREVLHHPERLEAWQSHVPDSLLNLADHARALEVVYAEAVDAGPPPTAPPPPRRTSERWLKERAVANRELEIHRLRGRLRE